jgi:hypothetical protein
MACAKWLLPVPPWAEKQRVLTAIDKGCGSQIKDKATIHLGVEGKVEGVESLVGIPKTSALAPAFQQPIGARGQLVGDQSRKQINGRHGLGLCLVQTAFEHLGHSAETELAQ